MRLKYKQFNIYKDWIYLLPTIQIDLNNAQYMEPNFAICFHFLVFHARLLWLKETQNQKSRFASRRGNE